MVWLRVGWLGLSLVLGLISINLFAAEDETPLEILNSQYKKFLKGKLELPLMLPVEPTQRGFRKFPVVEKFRFSEYTKKGPISSEPLVEFIAKRTENLTTKDPYVSLANFLTAMERVIEGADAEVVLKLLALSGEYLKGAPEKEGLFIRKSKNHDRRPFLVRREARKALLRIPVEVSLGPLTEVLMREPSEEVLQGLRKPGGPKLKRPTRYQRINAARILWALIEKGRIPFEDLPLIVEAYVPAVADSSEVRERVQISRFLSKLVDYVTTLPGPNEDEFHPARDECIEGMVRAIETADEDAALVVQVVSKILQKHRSVVTLERLSKLLAQEPFRFSKEIEVEIWTILEKVATVRKDPARKNRKAYLEWYEAEKNKDGFKQIFSKAAIERSIHPIDNELYAKFFGIEVVGKKVLLLVDMTGSMDFPLSNDDPRGEKRITRARTELGGVIEGLHPETSFNIVFFADSEKAKSWKKWFVPADKGNKDSAWKFVNKTNIGGGTNVYAALIAAFRVGAAGAKINFDPKYRPKNLPDQIIFLSDGTPSLGKILDSGDLIDMVYDLNWGGEIRIDTVSLGSDAEKEFLKILARENGGESTVYPAENQ